MTGEPGYEELPQPKRRRAGQIVLVVLVLAAGGTMIARLADSPGAHPDGAHTAEVVPTPRRPVVGPPPHERHSDLRAQLACPRADDGQVACTTYSGLAASTVRALRARFPHIVVIHAVTQMLRDTGPESPAGLWSREISARVGALRLRIAIRRAEPRDRLTTGIWVDRDGQLIRYLRGPYLIALALRGPVDGRWASRTLAWLRSEPRLVRPVYSARGTIVR
jgi:hypothetical protein